VLRKSYWYTKESDDHQYSLLSGIELVALYAYIHALYIRPLYGERWLKLRHAERETIWQHGYDYALPYNFCHLLMNFTVVLACNPEQESGPCHLWRNYWSTWAGRGHQEILLCYSGSIGHGQHLFPFTSDVVGVVPPRDVGNVIVHHWSIGNRRSRNF
jgi:hypothetical protein